VHPAVEFSNQVILDFMKLAKLIRTPGAFAETPKEAIPNPNGAEISVEKAA